MATYAADFPTANDRFKRSFDATLGVSLVLATILHLLLFELWPEMRADHWGRPAETVIDVVRVEDVALPEAPQAVARPAAPVVSADVSPEQTLPTIAFDEYVELPPPPPAAATAERTSAVPFTPYTLAPVLTNPDEVQRALQRAYPTMLRDAGLGGTVTLLLHVDATGAVTEARVGQTSGYTALDDVGLELTDLMSFRPAMNRDVEVAVWIQIPVTFEVR